MTASPAKVASRWLEAAKEKFYTDENQEFKIESKAFAQLLVSRFSVKPGMELGQYLRGEKRVPDSWASSLQRGGAVFKRPPRDPYAEPRQKGINLQYTWDKFVAAVYNMYKRRGTDVADMFLNMPRGEKIENWIQTVSADLSTAFEYDLEGPAQKWWSKMVDALKTGEWQYDSWFGMRTPSLKDLREEAQDVVSSAWADAATKEWEKIKQNKKRFQELQQQRSNIRW